MYGFGTELLERGEGLENPENLDGDICTCSFIVGTDNRDADNLRLGASDWMGKRRQSSSCRCDDVNATASSDGSLGGLILPLPFPILIATSWEAAC